MPTPYKTLSSFTESPTVAQSDYIVGYSFPIFDGERRWKWTSIVNQITADMLGPMSDGQLLIGNSATNAYVMNTLTEGNGIGIANGAGTITISVKPETPTVVNGPTINVVNDWHGKMIVIDNAAANVTVNLDSTGIDDGLDVSFIRAGTGTVEFVAGAGTTAIDITSNAAGGIRSTPDNTFRKIAFTNSVAGAYYSGSGVWYIFGDLLT